MPNLFTPRPGPSRLRPSSASFSLLVELCGCLPATQPTGAHQVCRQSPLESACVLRATGLLRPAVGRLRRSLVHCLSEMELLFTPRRVRHTMANAPIESSHSCASHASPLSIAPAITNWFAASNAYIRCEAATRLLCKHRTPPLHLVLTSLLCWRRCKHSKLLSPIETIPPPSLLAKTYFVFLYTQASLLYSFPTSIKTRSAASPLFTAAR
jgi:hypothetical protein